MSSPKIVGLARDARLLIGPKGTFAVTPDITEHESELADLCRRYDVRRLELFGSSLSAADFDATKSDLDFLVEFEPSPSAGYANAYFGLLEELERLFGRSVDLVVDSAIRNPYFRQSIERNRALLYGA